MAALSVVLIFHDPLYFIAAEILIIISVVFSILLYSLLIKPIGLIMRGTENIRDKDFSARLVNVGQNEMDTLINVYNSMLDTLREERILQQEKHFFLEQLIKASPSGIIIMDFDGKITHHNPASEKFLKDMTTDINGKYFHETLQNHFKGLAELAEGKPVTVRNSGSGAWKFHKAHFIDRGHKHYFIILEELTEEIRKAEKNSYDKIIRMMSHEINNSIGAINSILTSSLNYSPQLNEEDQADFENVMKVSIDRNNRLNRFMKNFADVVRIPPPSKTICDINHLVRDTMEVLRPGLSEKNINIDFNFEELLPLVSLDLNQFEQVLVNIIKNSSEALEKGGDIKIFSSLAHNSSILLEIKDNGKGIDDHVAQNLFTPFFSGKKNGQGIGLTLVREILDNHKFSYSLRTEADGWTNFRIEMK